jgi:transposase
MSTQLHKNFTDGQVKSLFESYLDKKIKIDYTLQILRIKRRKFFELLAKYRKDPDSFSIQYERKTINRKINPDIERNIVKELKIEKDVLKAYQSLWKIEKSFRIMKSTLEVRSVFHWTEPRIKGHFVICFPTFLLERALEFKLKKASPEASPQKIQEVLNSMNFAEVKI